MHARRFLIAAAILVAVVAISAAGCTGSDSGAQTGDAVAVYYTLIVDGVEQQSNFGGKPLEFTLGTGETVSGFNDAVIGMKVGETKTVTLPPDQAYGEHDDAKIIEIPLDSISGGADVSVGDTLYLSNGYGGYFPGIVAAITSDRKAVVDYNSAFAGKTLTFTIQLVSLDKESQ